MLGESTYFLLLVPVSVLLPGLAQEGRVGAGLSRADGPAAGLVAHEGLDPFGERSHVLLKQNHMPGVSASALVHRHDSEQDTDTSREFQYIQQMGFIQSHTAAYF